MIWYVHRSNGPGTPISWAGHYDQPGYADEALDDATDAELQAFLAAAMAVKPVPPTPRVWLERLSPATQAAITSAAAKDTSGALLLWLLKASGNPVIDVTAPETIAGVAALVSIGIITAQDQAALLAP